MDHQLQTLDEFKEDKMSGFQVVLPPCDSEQSEKRIRSHASHIDRSAFPNNMRSM